MHIKPVNLSNNAEMQYLLNLPISGKKHNVFDNTSIGKFNNYTRNLYQKEVGREAYRQRLLDEISKYSSIYFKTMDKKNLCPKTLFSMIRELQVFNMKENDNHLEKFLDKCFKGKSYTIYTEKIETDNRIKVRTGIYTRKFLFGNKLSFIIEDGHIRKA